MEANMVKSLSLAGEVFLAGEVVNAPSGTARTHVSRWKTLDCLSDPQICLLGPHITGRSPLESDSYHKQLWTTLIIGEQGVYGGCEQTHPTPAFH